MSGISTPFIVIDMFVYVCIYNFLEYWFCRSFLFLAHPTAPPLSLRPLVSDGEGHKEGLEQGWAHTSLHSFSF